MFNNLLQDDRRNTFSGNCWNQALTAFSLERHRDIGALGAGGPVHLAQRRIIGPICAANGARSFVIPQTRAGFQALAGRLAPVPASHALRTLAAIQFRAWILDLCNREIRPIHSLFYSLLTPSTIFLYPILGRKWFVNDLNERRETCLEKFFYYFSRKLSLYSLKSELRYNDKEMETGSKSTREARPRV